MNVKIGKYIAQNSFLDRFDPRLKLISFIFFSIIIFLPLGFTSYFVLLLLFLITFFWSRLPIKTLRNIFLGSFFIFLFLMLFNTININFDHENSDHSHHLDHIFFEQIVLIKNFFIFSERGLFSSLYYTMRIFLILLLTTLLTFTISIDNLTLGLEDLLKPLKKLRFPTHIFVMIITLTFRLLPTIIEESNTIILAQSSRGLDFRNAPWRKKVKALVSLIIPLLSSIFQRSHEMAFAMESRGYDPYKERTHLKVLIANRASYFIFMIILFLFIGALLYFFIAIPHLKQLVETLGKHEWWTLIFEIDQSPFEHVSHTFEHAH